MIIYSVTISLDPQIEEEWKDWMVSKHIPDVMNTGMFLEKKMTKVIEGHEDGTINYNIQYLCETRQKLDEYSQKHAGQLQQEHAEKYKDRFLAFRTILEVID